MLAVFDESVATSPEGLFVGDDDSSLSMDMLIQQLPSNSVIVNLGHNSRYMAYSSSSCDPFAIPTLFAAMDDVFCLFRGDIENIGPLRHEYGLSKLSNQVCVVIEAYRALRDRGPEPAHHVLRNIEGKFVFSLYDSSSNSIFIAADANGGVPFFWGTDSAHHLLLSDDEEITRKACGKSFAPFPKGCFFTSSGGLRNYEHPHNKLKAVPWVDSVGQVCGATYVVDEGSKHTAMPRHGSAADWSKEY